MSLSNSADFLLEGLSISSTEPGLAVITIASALDILAIVPFKVAVDRCIDDGNLFVVVDLENVNFIDSPFVGTLMGCRKMLQQNGGDLAICSVPQFLQERLSIMGLNRVFHFYTAPQTASQDFRFLGSRELFNFTLPLQRNSATLLRRFVCAVLAQKGFKPRLIFHIETIIDELANNAVDYSSPEGKNFFASASISRKKIILVFKNSHENLGKTAMDTLFGKYKNPKIDEESARGRGISLVRMLSNSVNVDISQTTIIVQVTKIVEV
ncbi:MAG: STAS domain-containing protein [Fibromonadaceae bacterium]|jgi:anti-sigma B factor antagonist|nr:STAS domain-containing protein [Fibromonadaceae bacterium]